MAAAKVTPAEKSHNDSFSIGVFALSNRFLIVGLLALLVAGGIAAMLALRIEAYPDIADTEVVVITEYPGRAATEVESLVTRPIERGLTNIPGLIARRSTTISGLSQLRLTFQDGVSDYFARAQVLERLRDVDLPEKAGPAQLGPLTSPVGEIYRYVIETKPWVTPMAAREAQDWVVAPAILRTEGVTDLTTVGGDIKQFQVIVNPELLAKYGIDVTDLGTAIENNNANTGGGLMRRGLQSIPVRAIGAVRNEKDLATIVVGQRNNAPIFLYSVADVKTGVRPHKGLLGYRFAGDPADHPHAVEGIVLMLRGENPSQVINRLETTIETTNLRLKELGMRLRTVLDRSDLVKNTLRTVVKTLFEGISIVLIVIIFFLRTARAALITAVVIPLSLLFAFILMYLSDIPANLLSLGAIDFGIVVDGAVVVMEAILRKFHATSDADFESNRFHIIGAAMKGVEKQIVVSVSIIICAYIPIFLFQRVEGKLFRPMAFTIAFALIGALILAVVSVPVLASFVYKKPPHERPNRLVNYIQQKYENLLLYMMQRLNQSLLAIGLVVAALLSTSYFVGVEFLPELDEGSVNLRCIMPSGTSLEESARVADRLRNIIAEFPEVASVVSAAGRNDDGTDPYNPNRVEITVPLKPYGEWKSGRNRERLREDLEERLRAEVPGARFAFSQPIIDNVSEAVTGSVADLAVILHGQDLDELRQYAMAVHNVIKKIPGAEASGIEQEGPETELTVNMDRLAAARFGVNFSDIQNLVEMAVGGKAVSSLYQDERKFEIAIRFPEQRRASPAEIGRLPVKNSSNSVVPLSTVAKVEYVAGQSVIARKNGDRITSVWVEIGGRDQGSFVADAQKRVAAEIQLPPGMSIEWGGQFENLTRAGRRLMLAVPLAILIIFVILFLLFRDFRDSLLVLANVPFALAGGIVAILVRGMNFNISAGVGFISLFGVAVMSGVLMIYAFREKEKTGADIAKSVAESAAEEFRPILMMMTVAILGLMPAALATGIGSDVQRPLATVIVGGLISATILSFLGLPLLFLKTRESHLLEEAYHKETHHE